MKKLSKGKKVVLGIVALILLLVVGTCTYFLAEHYVFYPRTIQDVINKYEKMDAEKAYEYGYSVWQDGGLISYKNTSGIMHKDSYLVKNRLLISYTQEMSEDFLNSVAKKHNAEIVSFSLNTSTRTSKYLTIEFKKSYTQDEMKQLAKEFEKEPYVEEASHKRGTESQIMQRIYGTGDVLIKKIILVISLVVFCTLVALAVIAVVGGISYCLVKHYIFYPRTIQAIINKYKKMDKKKAFAYGYNVCPEANTISYITTGNKMYKYSSVIKNQLNISYTQEMSEDFLNSVAKKHNAEVVEFNFNTVTRTSDKIGIGFKKSYTEKELEQLAEELKKEPYVESVSHRFGAEQNTTQQISKTERGITKKRVVKISLRIFWTLLALVVMFVVGVVGYCLAKHYIFYPRTIQDVIDKYEKMNGGKSYDYCYDVQLDGEYFNYVNNIGVMYKDSSTIKNQLVIYYTQEMSEEFLNSVAKKHKAEIIEFNLNTVTRTSDKIGIGLKKSYTERELNQLAKKLEKEPYVESAECISGYRAEDYALAKLDNSQ